MAGFIADGVLAEVKQAADIVEIISRYVSLKKAGRNFKALCPFHTEKTPSFIVNPERQFFHCFGCGKKGDVFAFVAEHERVDFPEAVRIVAAAVGVNVPEGRGEGRGPSKELKTRLYDLHRWAAGFFARRLAEGADAAPARDYLAKRHFDKAILEKWAIGYAPDSWDTLGRAARKAGFSDQELLAGGLVIPRDNGEGHYDRFRNRVVFPIRDVQGRVIGFGARTLADSEVKYINSPETPLFSKSRSLYGLDEARKAIIEQHKAIITEGYTDTLMCHQCGVPWAVATLGTALTRDHVGILRRYAEQIVLVFDADQAGEAAVDRSLEVFADADLDVRVATTSEGTDPCDFLIAEGAERFLERLEAARELFAVKVDLACRKHDLATAAGQAQAIDEVLASIALISNAAKADLWVQEVAKRMGVDLEPVRRRLRELHKARRGARREEPAKQAAPLDPVEGGILSAFLARAELAPCVLARASLDDFRDERVRRILERCIELYDREGEIDLSELSATLQDSELSSLVAERALAPLEGGNWERWLQDCLDRLEDRKGRTQLRQLKEKASGDPKALAAIYEHHRRRAGRPDTVGSQDGAP